MKLINYEGDDVPNQELIDIIYETAANKTYDEQTKKNLF